MIENSAFYERLADVQLPAKPDLWPDTALIMVTVVVILFLIVTLICWRYRRYRSAPQREQTTTQQALERLHAIEQAWSDGAIDARETAYRLTTVLRLGLGLPQLTMRCPQPLLTQQQQWQQTITLFDQLRYQPRTAQSPTQHLQHETFAQLHQWLTIANHHRDTCALLTGTGMGKHDV